MKKIILLLALCLLGGMTIQAQTQNKKEKQEVVKLKNGHKVRGKIVTYAPLDSLVIQEDDGTMTVSMFMSVPDNDHREIYVSELDIPRGSQYFISANADVEHPYIQSMGLNRLPSPRLIPA